MAEEHVDGLPVEEGASYVSLCSGQILFSPSNSNSLPTNGIWIYFLRTCGCTSLLVNPLSIWENITGVSSRSERCYCDSKILLTLHYEIYMIDLRDVGIKIRERVDRFGCQPIRDQCSALQRWSLQTPAAFTYANAHSGICAVAHYASNCIGVTSRRPAELPTDKTDCWKCMANNPVMRNASRNVDAYALPVQITRAIISAVTSRQFQTARNFCAWFSNVRLRLLSKYPSGTLSLENRLLFANLDAHPDGIHLMAICSVRWLPLKLQVADCLTLDLSLDHFRLTFSLPWNSTS